jgi:GGDEF domain-containing protein
MNTPSARTGCVMRYVRACNVRVSTPNRELFDDWVTLAISLADRHDWTLAGMFFDLDQFKSVNDTHIWARSR